MTSSTEGHTETASHGAGPADIVALPANYGGCFTVGADGRFTGRSGATGPNVQNDKGFTCAAVRPGGGKVAVGDATAFVRVYDMSGDDDGSIVTRFTLPVRAVAFNHDGSALAASGDAEGIKILATKDNKVLKVLHSGPQMRDMVYDPEGAFLASVNCSGCVQVWDISKAQAILTHKGAAPTTDHMSADRARPCWHPDGSVLAVPGAENDAVVYERLSWEVVGSFSGAHSKPVNCVAFCSNGLYAVTVGRDNLAVVWEASTYKELARHELSSSATAAVWAPGSNRLQMVTEEGDFCEWEGVVPEDLSSPHLSLDEIDRLQIEQEANGKGGSRGEGAEDDGASDAEELKEFIEEEPEEDGEEDQEEGGEGGGRGRGGVSMKEVQRLLKAEMKRSLSALEAADRPTCQDPIQSGRFMTEQPTEEGVRRFLAFDMNGFITSRKESYGYSIEVGFHDVNSHRRRMPVYTDFYGFNLAAIADRGTVYASAPNAEFPSTILYRPFEYWAPKSDWTVALPAGEEARCLAVGGDFVAVATSRQLLRLFSPAGVQLCILSLPGAPVALAAHGERLTAVFHAGNGLEGKQQLELLEYDVPGRTQLSSGTLPLGDAPLVWFGYTSQGVMAMSDSAGVLSVRSSEFGGCWTPIFEKSRSADLGNGEEHYIAGVTEKEMYCIVCGPGMIPQAYPKPVISCIGFQLPTVGIDDTAAQVEGELLMAKQRLRMAEEMAGSGTEATLDEALSVDRCALKLVQHAIKNDLLERALELAGGMQLAPSLDGALRLAVHHHKTALAERISVVIEERQAIAETQAVAQEAEDEDFTAGERVASATQAAPRQQVLREAASNRVPEDEAGKDKAQSKSGGFGALKRPREAGAAGGGGGGKAANPFVRQRSK